MRRWFRKFWPVLKAVLILAILVAVGRIFARDLEIPQKGLQRSLEEFWARLVHPGWLVVSGAFYLLGLGFSALYWYRLLRDLDQRPGWLAAMRAYYVGHVGKYLPGKAWAVFLRAGLIQGPEVRIGRAILTTFYEVLTTMAGGALLALVLLATQWPSTSAGMDWTTLGRLVSGHNPEDMVIDRKVMVTLAVLLLLPIGIPILPPIYNRIVRRMAVPIRERYGITGPMAQIRFFSMLEGLVLTACGWVFLGASLWAVLCAIMPEPPALTPDSLAHYSALLALAYVAGFIIFVVPSGLGIREFFLTLFLLPDMNRIFAGDNTKATAAAASAVLLLRLVWTAAEVVIVPSLYWMPARLYQSTGGASGAATGEAVAAGTAGQGQESEA